MIIRWNCNYRYNLKCVVEFNGYFLIIYFVFCVVWLILYIFGGFLYLKKIEDSVMNILFYLLLIGLVYYY